MKIEIEIPDDLYHIQLSVIQLKKGGLQCHAYVQDKDLRMRGSEFADDPQSAVASAIKNLREAQMTVARPAAVPRFTLNLSSLTRKLSNGPDQS